MTKDIEELRWPVAQVRMHHPELTRCVHCGVLDAMTGPVVYVNPARDVVLLTVWLHETCGEQWKPPKPLAYEFGGKNYRPPNRVVEPPPPRKHPERGWRSWQRVKRRPPLFCYTCEKYETREHKFNRLGYEPVDGWDAR